MTSTSVCKRVRTQLGAFVDGELSGPDRSALSRHLEDCAQCVQEDLVVGRPSFSFSNRNIVS